MRNTNIIYELPFIQAHLEELDSLEATRIYCRHNLEHFLSVARICYTLCLEQKVNIPKDLIYTTALLHDLGRVEEIKHGTSHDHASVDLAIQALTYTDYTAEEQASILKAIGNHRGRDVATTDDTFVQLFKQADNLSRDCYNCRVRDLCKWSDERKNLHIKY
ncbi:hypothetical protein CL176_09270 [Suicoccus acidiformans]|uniref:HD domain-containing protein n=1 Tax=Suicoccus acidiformans TaxID=2036206 RepID=A0A347WM66_9LACT|nr:HD domain-containing protein [Suicoccus acidiformans]AXY26173.1 hypothetical protein CL176_09270 [Suicoccus acidiformans]